jgi:hypothetical protein
MPPASILEKAALYPQNVFWGFVQFSEQLSPLQILTNKSM